jgi:hypothetical protein
MTNSGSGGSGGGVSIFSARNRRDTSGIKLFESGIENNNNNNNDSAIMDISSGVESVIAGDGDENEVIPTIRSGRQGVAATEGVVGRLMDIRGGAHSSGAGGESNSVHNINKQNVHTSTKQSMTVVCGEIRLYLLDANTNNTTTIDTDIDHDTSTSLKHLLTFPLHSLQLSVPDMCCHFSINHSCGLFAVGSSQSRFINIYNVQYAYSGRSSGNNQNNKSKNNVKYPHMSFLEELVLTELVSFIILYYYL